MLVFRKAKMFERIERLGLKGLITRLEENMMDDIDGKEAKLSEWARVVKDEEVYHIWSEKYGNLPVLKEDCEEI